MGSVFRSTSATGGKLIQRVSTESASPFSTTTTFPTDNTIPQSNEGGELITLAITPTSISNKLVIRVSSYFSASTLVNVVCALFRDSETDALKAKWVGVVGATDYSMPLDVTFEVTPTSTLSQTYKFRIGGTSAATVVVNRLFSYTPLLNGTGVILMEIYEVAPYANTAYSSIIPTTVPSGRLTPTTGVPVITSESLDFTTVYYTPFTGNQIAIYNGSVFSPVNFSELSLALNSNSGHTGYHQSGKNFDLFVFNDNGTIRLGSGPAWTNDTTRADAITRVNGYRVNNASILLRFGSDSGNTVTVAAYKATLVGTMRASANGQCTCRIGSTTSQTGGKWFLTNEYNTNKFSLFVFDETNNWSYAVSSWRQANANAGNKIEFLTSETNPAVSARLTCMVYCTTASDIGLCGIGLDSTTVNSSRAQVETAGVGNLQGAVTAEYQSRGIAIGYHYLAWLEYRRTGTIFYIGDNGLTTGIAQTGLITEIFA